MEMKCPHCGSETKVDIKRGEYYCENCGYVSETPVFDTDETKFDFLGRRSSYSGEQGRKPRKKEPQLGSIIAKKDLDSDKVYPHIRELLNRVEKKGGLKSKKEKREIKLKDMLDEFKIIFDELEKSRKCSKESLDYVRNSLKRTYKDLVKHIFLNEGLVRGRSITCKDAAFTVFYYLLYTDYPAFPKDATDNQKDSHVKSYAKRMKTYLEVSSILEEICPERVKAAMRIYRLFFERISNNEVTIKFKDDIDSSWIYFDSETFSNLIAYDKIDLKKEAFIDSVLRNAYHLFCKFLNSLEYKDLHPKKGLFCACLYIMSKSARRYYQNLLSYRKEYGLDPPLIKLEPKEKWAIYFHIPRITLYRRLKELNSFNSKTDKIYSVLR